MVKKGKVSEYTGAISPGWMPLGFLIVSDSDTFAHMLCCPGLPVSSFLHPIVGASLNSTSFPLLVFLN